MDRDEEGDPLDNHILEHRVYILRKTMTHKMSSQTEQRFYICSLSTKTIVYKGTIMLKPLQPLKSLYCVQGGLE